MEYSQLARLLAVGRSLVAELDADVVLDRLLEVARELTGARYAAIGILDKQRPEQLERFLTKGIDEPTHRAIGDLPKGRGVLGVLIREPRVLRLADVGRHPESYGFPSAHPPMSSFLGVPIVVRGEAWGNLYLTEKDAGEFTQDDEDAVLVLADWAAIAIENSRLYRDVQLRHDELQRAMRGLETTTEVARALGGVLDLDRVLELLVKRSRALVEARAATLSLVDGDELVVAAVAGQDVAALVGSRHALEDAIAGDAVRTGRAQRLIDVDPRSAAGRELGIRAVVLAPMLFRNRTIGVLAAIDPLHGDGGFSEEDEALLQAFAASAATAVATAQSASNEALHRSVQASEQERRRWARELHDETLQELAAINVLLSAARRSDDPAQLHSAIDQAVGLIRGGIKDLRALIAELRPAALDELGAQPAIEALVERVRDRSGIDIALDVRLGYERGTIAARHSADLEVAIYRIVQEALTNIAKHAAADRATVRIVDADADADGGDVIVEISDNGRGFDSKHPVVPEDGGFGLTGMRERLSLLKGTLEVDSAPGHGTTLTARIPVRRRSDSGPTGSRTGSSG